MMNSTSYSIICFIVLNWFNLILADEYSLCNETICEQGIFKWHKSKVNQLYIGGIFPMIGSWPGGQACLPSAIMALNEINLKTNILPAYRLNLTWYNSECNPGNGISNLYNLLYEKSGRTDDIIMVLGPGCSDVSSSVAQTANYWNLTVLSFGSSSPALSNRERFKTFYRTHPSAILNNPARLALCKKYKWKKISTLQDTLEVFTSTVDNLEKEANLGGIEISVRQTFNGDPTDAVRNLKKQDARIIVGVFYEDKARKVFCSAYRENMLFPKYVWMIIGWYSEKWYLEGDEKEIGCNKSEMEIAVRGHFTTEIQMLSDDLNKIFDSGLTVSEYNKNFNRLVSSQSWKKYTKSIRNSNIFKNGHKEGDMTSIYDIYENINNENSEHIEKLGGYLERALAYDAVWATAYALNKTLFQFHSLADFKLNNYTVHEFIKISMDNTNFDGVSGPVWFTGEGDRISKVIVEQLQSKKELYLTLNINSSKHNSLNVLDISGVLQYKKLGTYLRSDLPNVGIFDCCQNITWGELNGKPPVDGKQYIKTVKRIDQMYSKIFTILSICMIVVICGCLVFNIVFRLKNIIESSLSDINNIMLFGCFLCMSSLILFGLDYDHIPLKLFNTICQAKIWTLSIGFTIGYGAMFTKIWFVYEISLRKKKLKLKVVEMPNRIKMYCLIFSLICIDATILTIWTLKDPLSKHQVQLADETLNENNEIIYKPHLEICDCKYLKIWIGLLFCFKGIIILFGLFLSYEIRNIKLEEINDSRFVALSIYNTVILTIITAPIVLLIKMQQDASYIFLASIITLCCFISLVLIFFPKIKHVIKHRNEQELNSISKQNKTSKNDERYQKLLEEHDTLVNMIVEREKLTKELESQIIEKSNNCNHRTTIIIN